MPKTNNAPLASGDEAEAIPAFCTTLTCTAFLFNGEEEHLELPEVTVRRFMAGEDFVITLPPKRDIIRSAPMSNYHFLRASAIYRLYVHQEMKEEVGRG